MPQQLLTLSFASPINTSLQIGDTIYYANPQPEGGFSKVAKAGVIGMGLVTEIINPLSIYPHVTLIYQHPNTLPNQGDYIMFGKDKTVNSSSLIGNYAEVTFKNDSREAAELFSIGSEVSESSK